MSDSQSRAAFVAAALQALLFGLAVGTVRAQAPQWQVPPRGAVRFEKQGALQWTAAGSRFGGDSLRHLVDPILFAADIAPDGRSLLLEPWSLQSLGPVLALDLSWGPDESVERTFPRVEPYGEVTVRGQAHREPDGEQVLVLSLQRADIAPYDADAEFQRVERHYYDESLTGQLIVRRRLADQGLGVASLRWEIDAKATHTSGRVQSPCAVTGGETWRRLEIVPARYAGSVHGASFGECVATARANALAALRRELVDASVREDDGEGNVQGPSLLAVRLAALARSGVRAMDPDAAAVLASLPERELRVTSGIAFAILAVAWLHAPPAEAPAGRGERSTRRQLPTAASRYLHLLADQLLARRLVDGDRIAWAPLADRTLPDQRQTWLATAALDEAARCGAKLPKDLFAGVARHLLAAAIDGGFAGSAERHPGHCSAEATAGCVAALSVCARRLAKGDRLQPSIRAAIAAGLDWLRRHGTARYNGAPLCVLRQHEDFAAMALAILADEQPIETLGPRDPYFELASVLLLRQRRDGVLPSTVFGTAASLWLWRPAVVAPITPR